jgi:hypothetical protein
VERCTLEAAEAVCIPDGNLDVLEGAESLAAKSLLRQEESAEGEARFVIRRGRCARC